MEKKILPNTESFVTLIQVKEYVPIFAKKDNIIVGMVVRENKGWILKLGGSLSFNGHYQTREKCLQTANLLGYTFFIDI